MKHLGDITKIDGHNVPLVDIVCGGSPCQDLSVAGKRAGLAGERSGLFMEQIRIVKEMRNESAKQLRLRGSNEHIRPRYMVWENVPGAFSSNKGEDFRAVLEETAKVTCEDAAIPRPEGGRWSPSGCIMGDGWSIAWRVHDAQFWGVPQRRKRIALVADFGGDTAPKILFESEGLPGDSETSSEEGEEVAASVGASINPSSYTLKVRGGREIDSKGHKAGKGALVQTELSGTLGVSQDQTLIQTTSDGSEVAGTLDASYYKGCGLRQGREHTVVYGISAYDSNAMKSSNPNSGIYEADTTRTLDNNGGNPACNQGGMMVVQGFDGYNQQSTGNVSKPLSNAATDSDHVPIVCLEGNGSRPSHKGDGYVESDTMYTLNSTEHHAVCVENHPADSRVQIKEDGVVQTLSGRMGTGGGNVPLLMDTYQKTTGALMASGYDKLGTQEAANDMYVVQSNWDGSQIAPTLNATSCDSPSHSGPSVLQSIVRRLTPLECERLQGFPDHWTDIGEWTDSKGKVHKDADSPRYKALGNSIALPFWQWMAVRMRSYLHYPCTMASLFDGIGGFPLVYSRQGCTPVWASEIEEFPIAVTKIRFPEDDRQRNDSN